MAFLAGLVGILFSLFPAFSADNPYFEYENELLNLINQTRQNPIQTMQSMEFDINKIFSDMPELREILEQGMPALVFSDGLYEAARSHSADMIENNIYGHESSNGTSAEQRILDAGYLPEISGETIGALGFVNFVTPGDAVQIVFKNMLADELRPGRPEPRNILNPDLTEIGIAMNSGPFELWGMAFNLYVVTCDFARSAMSAEERLLIDLINEARANPLAMAESLGIDPRQILTDHPKLAQVLTDGMAPLKVHRSLRMAAVAHVLDMIENRYYGFESADGRTVRDRLEENGYAPVIAGEALCLRKPMYYDEDAGQAIQGVFEQMFRRELAPGFTGPWNLLNPFMRDMGVGSWIGVSDLGGTYGNTLLVAIDFGAPAAVDREKKLDRDRCQR